MKLKVGDFIIFRKWKSSTSPSPQAKNTYPSQSGEMYSYGIDKYWKVVEVVDDQTIEIETRRGKRHRIEKNPSIMRKASFLDKLLHKDRFFWVCPYLNYLSSFEILSEYFFFSFFSVAHILIPYEGKVAW